MLNEDAGIRTCPICNATRFCAVVAGKTVVFSVSAAGAALDVVPADTTAELAGGRPIDCTSCSWRGEVAALKAPV